MTEPLLLEPGVRLELDGDEYVIEAVRVGGDGGLTSATLRRIADDSHHIMGIDWLLLHPNRRTVGVPKTAQNKHARPLTVLDLLTDAQLRILDERIDHMREAETGYKSGSALQPRPGEPRAQYNPALVPLATDRRRHKEEELAHPGYNHSPIRMSYRTLMRLAVDYRQGGRAACADARLFASKRGHLSVSKQVYAAIKQVYEDNINESNLTLRGWCALVVDEIRSSPEADVRIPSDDTLIAVMREMYPGGLLTGKARHRRNQVTPRESGFSPLKVTRIGEYAAFDAWHLEALLKNTIFEGALRGSLLLGMDLFSISLCSVAIAEVAETAEEVTGSLREFISPKVFKEGWPDRARWAYVGVPRYILEDMAGTDVAAMPFVNAENVVVDHGSPFKSRQGRAAVQAIGASLIPARRGTPTDKAQIEHVFVSIRTMLVQYLRAYRGSDVSESGRDIDRKVAITADEMENLVRLFIILIWQNHVADGLKPSWCPEGKFTPNQMYVIGLNQTGIPALPPADLGFALMRVEFVTVRNRGFRFKNLIYDSPLLKPYRNESSKIGGRADGRYLIRYDRRDMNRVWLQQPETGQYIEVWWIHADPENTVAFSDRHARALQGIVTDRRISPYDTAAIRQVLFDEVLSTVPSRAPRSLKNDASRSARRARQAHAEGPSPVAKETPPSSASQQSRRRRARVDAGLPRSAPGTPTPGLGIGPPAER